MKRFTGAWAQGIVQFRAVILIITALLLILAPLSFQRLYHDDSMESYFLENDPNLQIFNQLLDKFGDNEYLLVGAPARPGDQDVFTADTLQMIDQITRFLEDHRHVTQVRSLSKYQYTHNHGGLLATDDLFEDISNLTAEDLAHARNIMQGEQLALDLLVTEDFQHTRIAARTEYRAGENDHKVAVVTELREFIDAQGFAEQGFELHLSGIPVIGERFETLTQRDMAWINPVMTVLMIIILYTIFRSAFATAIPLLVIGAAVLLTTSLQGWLRWPFTAVNSALIPTVIILSVGASIHVLVEFFQFRRTGSSPAQAAQATTQDLIFPVFFTCLTTAAGFVTLALTELAPVRQFALLAASAAMLIFLLTMVSLPALLSYVPWVAKGSGRAPGTSAIDRFLAALPAFTFRRRKPLALLGLAIVLFSVYGVTQITVDTNIINYFKKNSWVSQDLRYFDETFKGIANLEVMVDTGYEGGIRDPETLQRADALQSYLESREETGKAISMVRFYKQIHQALQEDRPEYFKLPTSSPMAAQFLLLYENSGPEEDLSDLKDFYEQHLRISVPVINMNARAMAATLDDIREHIADHFSDLDIALTGSLVMNNAQENYVNTGMFKSFALAIFVIGIAFLFLFRSLKYGIIALLPSVIPVILTGGIVSMLGIDLDLGTMIVGAMTIGIAVDDAIHLMSRYRLKRQRGADVTTAISGALATSGKAVILTSIVLVCGFSVMLLGSFVSYIYVGLFSAMIMLFALIGDLIFMPALLYLFDQPKAKTLETSLTPQQEQVHHG